MQELNLLRISFQEITSRKACQGSKARLAEFDDAAELVMGTFDSIPLYSRLRSYMKSVLNSKPNWGSKEVITKFDHAVKKIY
jgi:hypothetical protein